MSMIYLSFSAKVWDVFMWLVCSWAHHSECQVGQCHMIVLVDWETCAVCVLHSVRWSRRQANDNPFASTIMLCVICNVFSNQSSLNASYMKSLFSLFCKKWASFIFICNIRHAKTIEPGLNRDLNCWWDKLASCRIHAIDYSYTVLRSKVAIPL